MNTVIHSHDPITAIGGGDVDFESLEQALSLAPCLVAADGGPVQPWPQAMHQRL